MKSNKTVLVIEDNFNHFTKIKKLLKGWSVLPDIKNQSELTTFLYGTTVVSEFENRLKSASILIERMSEYISLGCKYEYISAIILDVKLSSIEDDNPEEGYAILRDIRNMYIDNPDYRSWNKVLPIIILSQYKENVKKALKGKAITNLCLNKQEIFDDETLLSNYIEHLFNYFEIIKNNLFEFNSITSRLNVIDSKLEHSRYRLDEIIENIDDLLNNTSFLIEAAFHQLKPSQRQELIDNFDNYLPDEIKNKFEATYFSKLKEDLKNNVDDIELFVKTLEYAPITIFTTLRDVIMGMYKL